MKKTTLIAVSTLLFGAVSMQSAFAQAGAVTNQDFTKLSESGTQVFIDVSMARLALFDGHPDKAGQLISRAKTAMTAAEKDKTAYLKDSAKLTSVHGAATADTDNAVAGKGSIAWLPIGGDVTIVDDYTSNPAKIKAVAVANESLKKGDRDGALKQFKLADVNVVFSVDVVPMQATQNRIDEASGLMTAGKYYEAGQVMRQVQDSMRIDSLDVSMLPKLNKDEPKKK